MRNSSMHVTWHELLLVAYQQIYSEHKITDTSMYDQQPFYQTEF
jgi:hypothetical protein